MVAHGASEALPRALKAAADTGWRCAAKPGRAVRDAPAAPLSAERPHCSAAGVVRQQSAAVQNSQLTRH